MVRDNSDILLYMDWSKMTQNKIFIGKSSYSNLGLPYNNNTIKIETIDGKKALYLANNYIHINRDYIFEEGLCKFSIIMQVYPTKSYSDDYHIFINKENQFEIGYKGNRFAFASKRKWHWYYSPANYPPNHWYTVLLTYDGKYGKLWVNGKIAVQQYYGTSACNPVARSNIWIGARSLSGNLYKLNRPKYSQDGYYGKIIILNKPITWDEVNYYLNLNPTPLTEFINNNIFIQKPFEAK